MMAVDHADDGDRASDKDGADRNQQTAQAEDGIDQSVHSPSSPRCHSERSEESLYPAVLACGRDASTPNEIAKRFILRSA